MTRALADFRQRRIFYLSWALWLTSQMLSESLLDGWGRLFVQAMKAAALLGVVISEVMQREPIGRDDLIWLGITVVFGISAVLSKDTMLFQASILIFGARSTDKRSLMIFTFAVILFWLAIIVFLSFLNYEEGLIDVGTARGARFKFGFVWPSRAGNYLLTLILLYIIIAKDRIKWSLGALLLAAAIGIFTLSLARNPFLFSILLLTLAYGSKALRLEKIPRSAAILAASSFFICFAAIVALSLLYDPEIGWMAHLNRLMSYRLEFSHPAFESGALSLFGSDAFDEIASARQSSVGFLDSSYLYMLFAYGIIPTLMFLAGMTSLTYKAARNNNLFFCICMVCIAFHSVLEGQLPLINYTPMLFFSMFAYSNTYWEDSPQSNGTSASSSVSDSGQSTREESL